jgi:gluconolactonase
LPNGDVLVVEIARGTLTRVRTDGKSTVVAKLGGGPNGAAIGPDGHCYICNNGGFDWQEDAGGIRPVFLMDTDRPGRIERVDLNTGRAEVLYTHVGDRKIKAPNDIVFDSHGGFWFTDLGRPRSRDLDRGSVIYAKTDGEEIREVIFPMITPNGIGMSPDGNTLYVAETETARLWSYEITGPGMLSPKTRPMPLHGGKLVITMPGYQRFDSLAVEANGNICVATPATGCVSVITPAGELLEQHRVPDPVTTNICFAGDDLRTAFVTLSHTGKLVTLPWPRPGLRLAY